MPIPLNHSGAGSVTLKAPTSGTVTYTLPGADGTSGQVLSTNGSGTLSWASAGGGGATGVSGQVFTSSGTFTIPSGVTAVKVTVVGGGGGGGYVSKGGSASGGGGGGGIAVKYITGLTPGAGITVTVGGAAGTSSFGAYCSATGGATAATVSGSNTSGGGGAGGTATGGDINLTGGSGGSGVSIYQGTCSPNLTYSGSGASVLSNGFSTNAISAVGCSEYGRGGAGVSGLTNGNAGYGYGSGGSGATTYNNGITPRSGGAGTGGIVIVEW